MESEQKIAQGIVIKEEEIMGRPSTPKEVEEIVKKVSDEAIQRGDKQWREVNT